MPWKLTTARVNHLMTKKPGQSLESALIKTVKNELQVMASFCQDDFPCDLATTVAMRISRAVVSSICRLGTVEDGEYSAVISIELLQFLIQSEENLQTLSTQYEQRLNQLPDNELEWKTWSV